MQYLNKRKNIFGEGGAQGGHDDDRFSLDKMNLDRKDLGIGGDHYDPFFKSNVSSHTL
jgi:hypothetical protein